QAALLNLISNSRDAMPSGGTITLSTAPAAGPAPSEQPVDPDAPQFIAIRVADHGTGILEELQARVFEPFSASKDFGRGSRRGLSQVSRFASQSGGHAHLDSAPGRGTRVTLLLPVTPDPR